MGADRSGFDGNRSVDEGLRHLAARLPAIITRTLASHLNGAPWTSVLTELDRMRGRSPRTYDATDLQAQLRILTERLGALGYPFDSHNRLVSTLGGELRIVRNRWAHHDDQATIDAWRAHDFVVRLLEHFADEGAREATRLRDEAFAALAHERGIAGQAEPLTPVADEPATQTSHSTPSVPDTAVVVRPDDSVLTRNDPTATPTIGTGRSEFEPWVVVVVGDQDILDDLPKKVAKEKVRAVAMEIAEFEGPIHIDRLAQLTAASFGLRRLWPARQKKLVYQIRQTGLVVDDDKFVWPSDLDPAEWDEFRPNDSTVDRAFTDISPREIANAMRWVRGSSAGLESSELDAAVLRTFGRARKTAQFSAHLDKARALI